MEPFRWDARRDLAALRIAANRMQRRDIAAEAGVDRRTLREWTRHPEFAARVEALVATFRQHLERVALADESSRYRRGDPNAARTAAAGEKPAASPRTGRDTRSGAFLLDTLSDSQIDEILAGE
jgi:hypothetical protein